jgi:UDP-N-acetylmuramate--alanine ligase
MTQLNFNKKDIIHFIGIGGIGMSGIALILKKMGYEVQGSDISKKNKNIDRLKKNKIKVFNTHKATNIKQSKIIVISSAIKKDNPELNYANKSKKILIIKRADMLAHIISLKKNIVVSGSHGKTTITSLVSTILKDAHYNPTIVNGGIINSMNSNADLGNGEWTVIEADESDGSFLKFNNTHAIVSNIDFEHMDYYKNFNNLKNQFKFFLEKTPLFGKNIICIDDKNIKKIKTKINNQNFITYGFTENANFVPINIKFKDMKIIFDLKINLKKQIIIKNIILNLIGKHNVLNATASIIAALNVGVPISKIKKSLKNFSGVQRRMTKILDFQQRLIFDDYAHHPTEITSVLSACKSNFTNKRIVSIFQPHRYSRVTSLYDEFSKSFILSDLVVLCPIYAAGEKHTTFDLHKFAKNISVKSNVPIVVIKDEYNLEVFLKKNLMKNDIVVSMGAGNISSWIRNISKNILDAKIWN